MARETDITRRDEPNLSHPESGRASFGIMERFADEVDRLFDDFGHNDRCRAELGQRHSRQARCRADGDCGGDDSIAETSKTPVRHQTDSHSVPSADS